MRKQAIKTGRRAAWLFSCDPWGNVTNTTNDPINNFTFVGRYGGSRDWDTGFVQFWNRWYDSDDGRWISTVAPFVKTVFDYVKNFSHFH